MDVQPSVTANATEIVTLNILSPLADNATSYMSILRFVEAKAEILSHLVVISGC